MTYSQTLSTNKKIAVKAKYALEKTVVYRGKIVKN